MDFLLYYGFFLDDKFADAIADRAALGLIYAKFQAAGHPGQHGLEQTGRDVADRFIGILAGPADRAAVDRPYECIICFVYGGKLVSHLGKDFG